MDNAFEFIYSSKEISLNLDIASSTLRTWCLKLEASGYLFKRSHDGRRMFFERDIIALRMMQKLLEKKHPIESVASQISSKFNAMTHSVIDDKAEVLSQPTLSSKHFPNQSLFIQEIRQAIREEVHQEVAATIDKQHKRLEEHIEQRDHQLMQVLREIQQQRNKKRWWQKLF